MIIPNGYIDVIEKQEAGLDENGFPISASEVSKKRIPCQYYDVSQNLAAKNTSGDPIVMSSYRVLIENAITPFIGEDIDLYDSWKNHIGRFQVLRISYLDAVGQTQLYI